MSEHTIGTREEWQAARQELAKLEAEQAERNEEIKEKRLELPWVPGREGVRVRHRGRQEDPRGALRRPLAAARLQRHVRARLLARRLPRLHQPGRRARRLARPPEPPRRDPDLLLAGADRPADRLQGADGLGVPVRLDLQHGLRVRLRPRDDRGAGAGDPRGEGDDRRTRPTGSRSGQARSGRSSRTGCARTRAGSPSRARTGPSTTPTPCRRPTRSSRRTSASWRSGCRSRHRSSSSRGARTSTRTDADPRLRVPGNPDPRLHRPHRQERRPLRRARPEAERDLRPALTAPGG